MMHANELLGLMELARAKRRSGRGRLGTVWDSLVANFSPKWQVHAIWQFHDSRQQTAAMTQAIAIVTDRTGLAFPLVGAQREWHVYPTGQRAFSRPLLDVLSVAYQREKWEVSNEQLSPLEQLYPPELFERASVLEPLEWPRVTKDPPKR